MLLCVTPILEHLIAHCECVLVIYFVFVLRYGYCVFLYAARLVSHFYFAVQQDRDHSGRQ